ncbi:hypothetical protein OOK31_03915 [Streptomyces sp. NBC_00249]|uniref:hypothetical protein n=1 Tax=Streptomyces sp. NBC_00249 TaxID=2975690 RepID=UPI0022597383|nr:hypothetical protein [Streptomyces sp. NBC_00249]MCX5193046.1 hypothetical protein [Streptomyces sp. NBC_00249]
MSETEQERPQTEAPDGGTGGLWERLGTSLDGLVELRKRRPSAPAEHRGGGERSDGAAATHG